MATTLTDPSNMKPIQMALVLSLVAWVAPTRAIRAQVLSMRERAFVMMAKLSGMSGIEIILKEMMPNLLPLSGDQPGRCGIRRRARLSGSARRWVSATGASRRWA